MSESITGQPIILRGWSNMTLTNAEPPAFHDARSEISDEASEGIAPGSLRFELFIKAKGGYVYGSTTAPGARAKVVLSEEESVSQGATLRKFVSLQAGAAGEMLSERCVRLAVFARLSNALTGSGKMRVCTAQAVTDLLNRVPSVPIQG